MPKLIKLSTTRKNKLIADKATKSLKELFEADYPAETTPDAMPAGKLSWEEKLAFINDPENRYGAEDLAAWLKNNPQDRGLIMAGMNSNQLQSVFEEWNSDTDLQIKIVDEISAVTDLKNTDDTLIDNKALAWKLFDNTLPADPDGLLGTAWEVIKDIFKKGFPRWKFYQQLSPLSQASMMEKQANMMEKMDSNKAALYLWGSKTAVAQKTFNELTPEKQADVLNYIWAEPTWKNWLDPVGRWKFITDLAVGLPPEKLTKFALEAQKEGRTWAIMAVLSDKRVTVKTRGTVVSDLCKAVDEGNLYQADGATRKAPVPTAEAIANATPANEIVEGLFKTKNWEEIFHDISWEGLGKAFLTKKASLTRKEKAELLTGNALTVEHKVRVMKLIESPREQRMIFRQLNKEDGKKLFNSFPAANQAEFLDNIIKYEEGNWGRAEEILLRGNLFYPHATSKRLFVGIPKDKKGPVLQGLFVKKPEVAKQFLNAVPKDQLRAVFAGMDTSSELKNRQVAELFAALNGHWLEVEGPAKRGKAKAKQIQAFIGLKNKPIEVQVACLQAITSKTRRAGILNGLSKEQGLAIFEKLPAADQAAILTQKRGGYYILNREKADAYLKTIINGTDGPRKVANIFQAIYTNLARAKWKNKFRKRDYALFSKFKLDQKIGVFQKLLVGGENAQKAAAALFTNKNSCSLKDRIAILNKTGAGALTPAEKQILFNALSFKQEVKILSDVNINPGVQKELFLGAAEPWKHARILQLCSNATLEKLSAYLVDGNNVNALYGVMTVNDGKGNFILDDVKAQHIFGKLTQEQQKALMQKFAALAHNDDNKKSIARMIDMVASLQDPAAASALFIACGESDNGKKMQIALLTQKDNLKRYKLSNSQALACIKADGKAEKLADIFSAIGNSKRGAYLLAFGVETPEARAQVLDKMWEKSGTDEAKKATVIALFKNATSKRWLTKPSQERLHILKNVSDAKLRKELFASLTPLSKVQILNRCKDTDMVDDQKLNKVLFNNLEVKEQAALLDNYWMNPEVRAALFSQLEKDIKFDVIQQKTADGGFVLSDTRMKSMFGRMEQGQQQELVEIVLTSSDKTVQKRAADMVASLPLHEQLDLVEKLDFARKVIPLLNAMQTKQKAPVLSGLYKNLSLDSDKVHIVDYVAKIEDKNARMELMYSTALDSDFAVAAFKKISTEQDNMDIINYSAASSSRSAAFFASLDMDRQVEFLQTGKLKNPIKIIEALATKGEIGQFKNLMDKLWETEANRDLVGKLSPVYAAYKRAEETWNTELKALLGSFNRLSIALSGALAGKQTAKEFDGALKNLIVDVQLSAAKVNSDIKQGAKDTASNVVSRVIPKMDDKLTAAVKPTVTKDVPPPPPTTTLGMGKKASS